MERVDDTNTNASNNNNNNTIDSSNFLARVKDSNPNAWTLKCSDCNMAFGDPALLHNHKARFCVGSQLGDPEALMLRRRLRDPDRPPDKDLPQDQEEKPRYDAAKDTRVQQLAELHGKQMEFLKNQNKELEQQREEIRKQLEALGKRQPDKDKDNESSEELLQELREEEEKSRRTLEELRRQLAEARRPVVTAEQPEANRPESKTFTYPVYHGDSLVEEIKAVKQAYLQNGGSDPEILAQLQQMLAEAQALEEGLRNTPPPRQPKEKEDSSELVSVELENKRLLEQLIQLQEQRILNKRSKDSREDDLEHELRRMRRDHVRKMHELQMQMERMRQDSMMDRMLLEIQLRNQNTAPPPPAKVIVKQRPPPPPPPITQGEETLEVVQPYEEEDGFVIFYDFVLNMEPNIFAIRLLVGLHNMTNKLGEPSVMPMVYTEPSVGPQMESICNAVIGARQPVRKCPSMSDLGIVVELQVAGAVGSNHDPTRLITRAWTKVPLFDGQGVLIAGRFKLPLRHSPIKPYVPFGELDDIAQYGDTELYYRIVHSRDASVHSMATIAATNRELYLPAPVIRIPAVCSPLSNDRWAPGRSTPLPRIGTTSSTKPIIGFQVDRVKHSDQGEGKVRLTAYYVSTGEVVQSETNPVTCTTTSVSASYKHEYHVFGQQEAVFNEVQLQADMVLMAFFYLRRRPTTHLSDMYLEPTAKVWEDPEDAEETLVAWAAVPLVLYADTATTAARDVEFDQTTMKVNTGTKTLPLFLPPAPSPREIPLQNFRKQRDWLPYHDATLRLHIFHGEPRAGSLTPSDVSADDDSEVVPESLWIKKTRRQPPVEPFLAGDGFDIYIDGCRNLPDSVTFTRVAARVLDRRYQVYGKDISTDMDLDSDVFNPVYQHRDEFREPTALPSAALLFKVYTVDKFYRKLTVVGYATLNVFVETGTEKQPSVDKMGLQISLNEGGHQLRLYQSGPDEDAPFTESCLRDSNRPIIPCASLLVRLHKVKNGPRGRPLQADQVQESDRGRLGLWRPRPRYSDGAYLSTRCQPTPGETRLFRSMARRQAVAARTAVAEVSKARSSLLNKDVNIHQYIRSQLLKSRQVAPLQQDLTFITPYSPKHGFRCTLFKAFNIPWANFTFGHICLNPPGAFYQGVPNATNDKPVFTEWLRVKSTTTCPAWQDGAVYFPRRSFHRYLCVVVHLQEIFVTSTKKTLKQGLLKQAWTAVQVFRDRYASVSTYQLPLIAGGPTRDMLRELAQEPCRDWIRENVRSGSVEVSTEYLPEDRRSVYNQVKEGQPITDLIPAEYKQEPEQFLDSLAAKFKSLVYKLYEEGGIGNSK
ncbi:uncharacterized protein LOC143294612 [Babylonia areolata]|uniref:uncharacterized protein LOC143294612 n=1 Tax=Babylonia areolata TaxID=304850 RepID=UPI003FD48C2C